MVSWSISMISKSPAEHSALPYLMSENFSFDMFGNYVVDHGTYKLTIQNLIKKEFEFMPGGTIAFGGNP